VSIAWGATLKRVNRSIRGSAIPLLVGTPLLPNALPCMFCGFGCTGGLDLEDPDELDGDERPLE
jgi:hypothetical protein